MCFIYISYIEIRGQTSKCQICAGGIEMEKNDKK